MKLGKTKDSRTRKQTIKAINILEVERLKEALKNQQEFTEYLLVKGHSISTTEGYVKSVEMFIRWTEKENIPIGQIGYSDVLHYIQSKRNTVKQKTVSSNINSIKHYFNFLALTNQTLENPVTPIQIKGIKRKILYHILSKTELENLYHRFEIPNKENNPNSNQNWFNASILAHQRNRIILGLMIYQGLNSTALSRLTTQDLKLREGKIYIAGDRKSNERTLKLEAHQIMDMMEYQLQTRNELLKLTEKQSEKLFISTGKGERFHNITQKLIKKLHQQHPKVTSIKQIRASVITHWLKIYNLREVQYRAGHRYVSSTESYLVNDLDDLQGEIDKYHPIH